MSLKLSHQELELDENQVGELVFAAAMAKPDVFGVTWANALAAGISIAKLLALFWANKDNIANFITIVQSMIDVLTKK